MSTSKASSEEGHLSLHPKKKRKHAECTDAENSASLRQCLGPGCVEPSQPHSKYCSEDCGMNLAAKRIHQILPIQIREWQKTPCIAEEHGKKLLEKIRREQQDTLMHLKDLDGCLHHLEAFILKSKQRVVRKHEESNKNPKNTIVDIFCVSCGTSIRSKEALRHMEHCYAKYERQTIIGSAHPISNKGAIHLFCNIYDSKSKTYCRHLKILCPNHSRHPKVPEDEVCGCPLVRDVFQLTGEACCLPKGQCNLHYSWEKLWRADIDLQRVQTWDKLNKLYEEEQKVQMALQKRPGLLALMMHQTIQHDPLTTDLLPTKADH